MAAARIAHNCYGALRHWSGGLNSAFCFLVSDHGASLRGVDTRALERCGTGGRRAQPLHAAPLYVTSFAGIVVQCQMRRLHGHLLYRW
jgi:hypothetical protein